MNILVNMLKERDINVQLYAINKLAEKIQDDKVYKELYSLLESVPDKVKVKIITILNKANFCETVNFAKKNIENEQNPFVRSALVKSLSIDKSGTNLPLIVRCLIDDDNRVRANALEALGNLKGRNVVDLLLPMKDDSQHRVRLNVLHVLYKQYDEAIFQEFAMLSKDDDKLVRSATAFTLSKIPSRKSFPLLLNLIKDVEPMVRRNAVIALSSEKNITYLKYFVDLYMKEEDNTVKKVLVNAMMVNDTEKSVDRLFRAAEGLGDEGKWRFCQALSIMKSDMSVSFLTKYLSSNNPKVRKECIEALGNYDQKDIIDLLLPYLNDPDEDVKLVAAKVLWKFGIMNAYTSLKKMVASRDENLKRKAKYVLSLMGL